MDPRLIIIIYTQLKMLYSRAAVVALSVLFTVSTAQMNVPEFNPDWVSTKLFLTNLSPISTRMIQTV